MKIALLVLVACFLLLWGCTQRSTKSGKERGTVQVLEKEFVIPGLERTRKLRVYLPPGYDLGTRRYPVLYMHDGQNLFDEATSYAGEWGVDEALDELFATRGFGLLVVGVDNGGEKRMNELSPWPNEEFGLAEGQEYMDFVVNVVKPYIDGHYRTLSGQADTAIMGSSMGGLISHFAVFNFPDVFSKAAIFSPSYWYSESVYSNSRVEQLADNARLYLLAGRLEGEDVVSQLARMRDTLLSDGIGESRLAYRTVADGEHNEAFWRAEFSAAIEWLFDLGPVGDP